LDLLHRCVSSVRVQRIILMDWAVVVVTECRVAPSVCGRLPPDWPAPPVPPTTVSSRGFRMSAIGLDQNLARELASGSAARRRTRTRHRAGTVGWKRRLDSDSSSPRCAQRLALASTRYHLPICICRVGSRLEKQLESGSTVAAHSWRRAQARITAKNLNAVPGSRLAQKYRTWCPRSASSPTTNTSSVERRLNRNAYRLDWSKRLHNGNYTYI